MEDIKEFQGEYRWLSNFWRCDVFIDGIRYDSSEAAFQAFKTEFGLKLQKQQFYNMLRNNVYRGKVVVPEYKKESVELIEGYHESIVSNELFQQVQAVLDGKRKIGAKLPSTINDDFPIKANLLCPVCGKQITGSKSKGNGGYYEYYHCNSKCGVRHNKKAVHESIEKLLDEVSLNGGIQELYGYVLTDVIDKSQKNVQNRVEDLQMELSKTRQMIIEAEDRLMSKEIDHDLFKRVTDRYFDKVCDLENKIANIERNNFNLKIS